jgi:hypothetical protein
MDLIYFFIEEVNHPSISKLKLIMNHKIRDSEKSSLTQNMDLIYFFIEEVNHPSISKLRLIMNHKIRDSEKSSLNFSLNLTSMLYWP